MVRPPGADRPLYTRIAASVKSRILAGTYLPGARLPSEEDLADDMGVSRSTMRQAIAHLRDAGYVTSRRGAGNFVAAELPIEPLSPQSGPVYSGFLDDLDNEANDVHEIQRTQRIITTNSRIAEDLHVPVGTKVVRYRATRLRHGAVYGVAIDHIPIPVATRITPEILALGRRPRRRGWPAGACEERSGRAPRAPLGGGTPAGRTRSPGVRERNPPTPLLSFLTGRCPPAAFARLSQAGACHRGTEQRKWVVYLPLLLATGCGLVSKGLGE